MRGAVGLQWCRRPGDDAGIPHYSIRPANNPDPSIKLTEAEMNSVKAKLEKIGNAPTQAKAKDFGCGG